MAALHGDTKTPSVDNIVASRKRRLFLLLLLMLSLSVPLIVFALLSGRAISVPVIDANPVGSAATGAVSVTLGGLTFVNKVSGSHSL